MSTDKNIQTVKDFFAAIGRGDREGLLALVAEDIEWIIPGEDWPLAGTRRGHAGLADLLQTASKTVETSTEPREFVAQGDRVLVVGFARGKIKATNKTFEDDWVFAITVRNGKVTNIREYIDTQALARASEMDASPRLSNLTLPLSRPLYFAGRRPSRPPARPDRPHQRTRTRNGIVVDTPQVRPHVADPLSLSATIENVRLISLHHPVPHYPKLANSTPPHSHSIV